MCGKVISTNFGGQTDEFEIYTTEPWISESSEIVDKRRLYSILVLKSEGKRPLGRPRRPWEDNIRRDLQEVGVCDENWLDLAHDRS